jgi:glycosyltransferase involved in cell wall biosynthesis
MWELAMKIVYIAFDPLKYPRIRKIAYTLRKHGIPLEVMVPKIKLVTRKGRINRLLFASINYAAILLQIMFVRGENFWVANSPDILVLPLILRRRKYILEYRSPWSIEVEEEFGKGIWSNIPHLLENVALSHAKAITLTTSKLLHKVEPYGKPIFVIPNYPLESFRPQTSKEDFRREQGVKPSLKIVIFIGRLSRLDGADLLPNMISFVLGKMNAVFWIIGDGPLYQSLKNLEHNHSSFVKFFGWQPYDRIPDFINASDVCISPKHETSSDIYYNEEGVQKISEYMLFRKPIVACGRAESKEYLLVREKDMGKGIVQALQGKVPSPTPRTWEEHSEEQILKVLSFLGANNL